MSFIISKKLFKAFVGDNTKGAHGKVCRFNTSIIILHLYVFDQVHVFSFFCTALSSRLDWKPTVSSRIHIGTWTVLGKEDLDDNCRHL